jgi:hypothetical protein
MPNIPIMNWIMTKMYIPISSEAADDDGVDMGEDELRASRAI